MYAISFVELWITLPTEQQITAVSTGTIWQQLQHEQRNIKEENTEKCTLPLHGENKLCHEDQMNWNFQQDAVVIKSRDADFLLVKSHNHEELV